MEKQFVTYKIALKLKELGFDEFCFAHYCNGDLITKTAILKSSTMQYYQQNNINPSNQYKDQKCTAPLWQQVIDWFRIKYGIIIELLYQGGLYSDTFKYSYQIWSNQTTPISDTMEYEEAREQAILKAIELCQKEK